MTIKIRQPHKQSPPSNANRSLKPQITLHRLRSNHKQIMHKRLLHHSERLHTRTWHKPVQSHRETSNTIGRQTKTTEPRGPWADLGSSCHRAAGIAGPDFQGRCRALWGPKPKDPFHNDPDKWLPLGPLGVLIRLSAPPGLKFRKDQATPFQEGPGRASGWVGRAHRVGRSCGRAGRRIEASSHSANKSVAILISNWGGRGRSGYRSWGPGPSNTE